MMDRRTLLVSLRPVSLLALGLEVDANGTGGPHRVSCNEGEAVACVASGPGPTLLCGHMLMLCPNVADELPRYERTSILRSVGSPPLAVVCGKILMPVRERAFVVQWIVSVDHGGESIDKESWR